MPIIAIPKEITAGEERVAVTPMLVSKLSGLGLEVQIENGAGNNIYAADSAYKGATCVDAKTLYSVGDIVAKVQPPSVAEVAMMKDKSILISFLYPHLHPDVVQKLIEKNITSFAMELIPRISRAQDMDALSSQATIAGYKAVLIAANTCKFFFPMLSTAAGSIKPAKVLIVGVGVAGLQAIATARRLGAMVSAYDVRKEAKQEAESLGAKFLDIGITAAGTGGYARELTPEEKATQQEALKKHISAQDIIITTAGVPGKPAPKIITQAMVEAMKPGAVIVDIMAEMGGNCELTKAGETVVHNNVVIVGAKNIFSSLANNASEMYARNILNLLNLMVKEGKINLDWNDEIIKGCAVTHEGKIINESMKK